MNLHRLPLALLVAIAFAAASALSQAPPQASPVASQTPGASSASQANGSNPLLPPGIAIPAELSKSVDAKKVRAGDKIEARVTMDMLSHGQIVVPRDSRVTGHVTGAKPRSKESPESTVGIAFDHISLKNGHELSLRTTVQAIGPSLKQLPFPENGNEVPDQAPPGMHSGNTPGGTTGSRRSAHPDGSPYPAGAPQNPDGSPYPAGTPRDVSGSTVASDRAAASALDPQSHGVVGMKGLSLSTSDQGSVVSSNTNNVHLDGGTQLILRTE